MNVKISASKPLGMAVNVSGWNTVRCTLCANCHLTCLLQKDGTVWKSFDLSC